MRYAQQVRQKQRDSYWEYTSSVLVMIGNMTIIWAGITLMLNHLIEWYHPRGGKALRKDGQIPRDFTSKLDYLKKMERDPRWTEEERDKLARIREALGLLNAFRVELIHGVLHQRNRYGTDWHITIAKEEGGQLIRRTATYTNKQITDNIKAMSKVSGEMSPFFAKIVGLPTR